MLVSVIQLKTINGPCALPQTQPTVSENFLIYLFIYLFIYLSELETLTVIT